MSLKQLDKLVWRGILNLAMGCALLFGGNTTWAATNCAAVTEIPQSECAALVSLYNSTNGPNWTDAATNNWNVTNTPCSWTGVTCGGGHVVELDRAKQALSGSLPDLALPGLLSLKLDHNSLTGSAPDFSMPNLLYLYLNHNQLSGAVPDFSNLGNLMYLSLAANYQLGGTIPDFSNLPNLMSLDLSSNKLIGSVPDFSNLPNLTSLNFYANQLTGTIPDFSNLPNLATLELSTNGLSGSLPNFSKLLLLERIGIYGNKLTGSIPNFSNAPNLKSLELFANALSGSIPDFSNARNLDYLSLGGNNLTGSIPDFSNLPNLARLFLNSNQLSGEIPNFSKLPNLWELRLYENSLSGSIPNFSNIPKLGYISLQKNKLSGSIPDFSNLPKLTHFSIEQNQLSGPILDVSKFPDLAVFTLHTNQNLCRNPAVDYSKWPEAEAYPLCEGRINQRPIASFTATPTTGNAPLTVNLDDSASYDPDGTIVKREWFVNGVALSPDGNGLDESMTFPDAGSYTIKLLVTDNDEQESEPAEQAVVVNTSGSGSLTIDPPQKDFGTMPVLPPSSGSQQIARRGSRAESSAEYQAGRMIVGFYESASEAERQAAREQYQADLLDAMPFIQAELWAVDDVKATLAAHASEANAAVKYLEPDYIVTAQAVPNDANVGQLWAMHNTGQTYDNPSGSKDPGIPGADVGVTSAWDKTQGSNGPVCAVLDSGVDYTHPDLAANMWKNPGEIPGNGIDDDNNGYVDDVYGWDFVDNDNDPMDDHGHGTHVAGTMAAVGNNGIGVTGMNWTGKIMALRWMKNSYGLATGSSYDAVRALNYAAKMGVKCTNNSWRMPADLDSVYDAILAYQQTGGLFVAAAGNWKMDNDKHPSYPASYALDSIISVCATDNRDRLAAFSHYGRTSVDLCAPGVDILSTEPGAQYGYKHGTSMAAPHVAGAAMLLWSARPDLGVAQIKAQLMATADAKLAGLNASDGRLNVGKALNDLPPPQTLTVSNTGTGSISMSQVTLSGSNAAEFKIIGNTCVGELGAGGTCKVMVSFLPVTEGIKQANLTVTSTDGSSASAVLSGNTFVTGIGSEIPIQTVPTAVFYPTTGQAVLPSVYLKGDASRQYNAVLCPDAGAFKVCTLAVQPGDQNAFEQAGNTIFNPATGLLSIPFIQVIGTADSSPPGMGNEGYAVELGLLAPAADGSIRFELKRIAPIW